MEGKIEYGGRKLWDGWGWMGASSVTIGGEVCLIIERNSEDVKDSD